MNVRGATLSSEWWAVRWRRSEHHCTVSQIPLVLDIQTGCKVDQTITDTKHFPNSIFTVQLTLIRNSASYHRAQMTNINWISGVYIYLPHNKVEYFYQWLSAMSGPSSWTSCVASSLMRPTLVMPSRSTYRRTSESCGSSFRLTRFGSLLSIFKATPDFYKS